MRIPRVHGPDLPGDEGAPRRLEGAEAAHLSRARRVRPGDEVEVFDGRGGAGTGLAALAQLAQGFGKVGPGLAGLPLRVAGMIGDPDPYDATMNALQFFNVDDVLISTLPTESSGWLRQQLLSRVRKASNVDVEHIVAERAGADKVPTEAA